MPSTSVGHSPLEYYTPASLSPPWLDGQGGTGTGTAYLYSAPGTSSTLTAGATLLATNAVSASGSFPNISAAVLFSNLTLPSTSTPMTYYVLLVPSNTSLAWATSNVAATETGPGITSNPDEGTTGSVASPPSGSTWTALSPNGMQFQIYASTRPSNVPPGTPAPPTWLLLCTALLLLTASGWRLRRRRRRA